VALTAALHRGHANGLRGGARIAAAREESSRSNDPNHIKRYWALRMRQKLNAYLAQGHGRLDGLPRAAVERLNAQAAAATPQPAAAPGAR
jgi:hypothetical protein